MIEAMGATMTLSDDPVAKSATITATSGAYGMEIGGEIISRLGLMRVADYCASGDSGSGTDCHS